MSRAIGETATVAGLPEWVVSAAVVVTALGDVWFVFLFLGVLYWFGSALPGPVSLSRPHSAFAVALALGGLALTTALKEWLRLPRPAGAAEPAAAGLLTMLPPSVHAQVAAADGFGFPSGHAVAAIVVYGGLALLIDSRRGYAVAGLLCLLIPLSRVVIGVHYLVDILVGLALGGGYLAAVYRLCGRGDAPGRAMMIALLVAVVGAAIHYGQDTMLALGGTLGARIAWGIVGGAVAHEETTLLGGAVSTAVGLAFASGFAALYFVEPAPYVSFLGMSVVVAGVLVAPLVGEAVTRRL